MPHVVVSRSAWSKAREELLREEKELTKVRDRVAQLRRNLPWEPVSSDYVFEGPNGSERLSELFDGRSQLIVYHFMFAPDWDAGCKSCSFWADNFDPIIVHLNHRDVSMVAISRAPYEKLAAYERRMGWSFKWLSSTDNAFNYDYGVSFRADDVAKGSVRYNYRDFDPDGDVDLPGISVFIKSDGKMYHTYSTYGRGLDLLNTAYNYLDLTPKGRDEGDAPQRWVRRHDEYDSD